MTDKQIKDEYIKWLSDLICGERYSTQASYYKLLSYLHSREFIFLLPDDENRTEDGIALRWRFAFVTGRDDVYDECIGPVLSGPCSVLEMMTALSVRMEESIMDNPLVGNRTRQWFWDMISNLGLGSMTDYRFDEEYVEETVTNFLNRDYAPDGRGGLFTVQRCERDLRDVEIWTQMLWYLDGMI